MEEDYRRRAKERERKKELRQKAVARQKRILFGVSVGVLVLGVLGVSLKANKRKQKEKEAAANVQVEKKEPEMISFTVSAAGDCTLGTDENFDWDSGFLARYEKEQDFSYFFRNVTPIFAEDDLTIVNMEGTLTDENTRADKRFAFKADKEYAEILVKGSVEAANFANNHSKDYGEKSYTDTIAALDEVGIPTFGYERTAIVEVKGVKVGLLGTYELAEHMDCEAGMIENINHLKEEGAQVIIASFHWGEERAHVPTDTQRALAHSAIDNGVDLVLGHHPHVLQGIEEYKGKNIVYSLANFCFGGNSAPSDMDTMIFQQTFTLKDGKLQENNVKNIIPCKISSSWKMGYNDYQPIPVEGETADAIRKRIEEYSQAISTASEQ